MNKKKYLNTIRTTIADENYRNLKETIRILNKEGWTLVREHKPGGTYFADMKREIYEEPGALNE